MDIRRSDPLWGGYSGNLVVPEYPPTRFFLFVRGPIDRVRFADRCWGREGGVLK